MPDPIPTPKVFISYAWTNDEHVKWVVALAERLLGDGVNVILDQWDFKEGHDKYVFMEQMVTDPSMNKVLAICDENYAAKADGRKGGVGTESQIISKDIYDKVAQEKFIPLIRERDREGKEYVPVFFRNRKYIDFSKDDEFSESYEKLLRVIFGRPELKKPPLGAPPAHLFADTTHVKCAGKLERLKDAVQRGKTYTQAVLQEYLDSFVEAMADFRIDYKREDAAPLDDQVVESVKAFLPYRDNYIDFIVFVAAYMNDDESYDRIHDFLERIIPFKDRPEGLGSYFPETFDNYRFIIYELFLYHVAALIKTGRYAAAVRFMDGTYHYHEFLGGTRYREGGAGALYDDIQSLDQYRNKRLNLGRHSVVADMIRERAEHPKIAFPDLLQADFLLFFRVFTTHQNVQPDWYPRCLVYGGRVGTFEIFAKATSTRGFEAARQLFKAKDLKDLLAKIQFAYKNQQLRQIIQSERFMYGGSIDDLLNIHSIQRQLQG